MFLAAIGGADVPVCVHERKGCASLETMAKGCKGGTAQELKAAKRKTAPECPRALHLHSFLMIDASKVSGPVSLSLEYSTCPGFTCPPQNWK